VSYTPEQIEAMSPEERVEAQDRIARAYLARQHEPRPEPPVVVHKRPRWPSPWWWGRTHTGAQHKVEFEAARVKDAVRRKAQRAARSIHAREHELQKP
jgi:hypothetical protein